MSEQTPKSLFYSGSSDDALNLVNYVDQVFNESPVNEIAVPLISKSQEDVKFDNKLNINFDNLSDPGKEKLLMMMSPSDNSIELDLTAISNNQGIYTAESSGYIYLTIDNPVSSDYITIKCTNNNILDTDYFKSESIPMSVNIPVSKYQVVKLTWNKDTSSTKTASLVSLVSDYNVGESIMNTRDYKALMANIGFPDVSNAKTLTLPPTKSSLTMENDGYYSIAAILAEDEYISISTSAYGDYIKYDGTNNTHYIFLPVAANEDVYFEYNLNHDINTFKFIPPIGKSGV